MSDVTLELAMEASDKAMEIARLKAENDRLRDERDHWHVEQVHAYGNWEDAYKRATELEAENAKLRELVKDYIDAPCTTCDCWQDEFHCWNYDGADCGLVARARELGVDE